MDSKKYFMGIDFGTQGVRCGIFDCEGNAFCMNETKYTTFYPQPGYAEQIPKSWIDSLHASIEECFNSAGQNIFEGVSGIAICATSSTVVPVDKYGKPLMNAILWMDNRSAAQAKKINETKHGILKHCGGEVSSEWIVPKMLWLKEKCPETFNRATRIVELQDFMNHYLTGRWCASVSQATCKSNYVESKDGYNRDYFNTIGLGDFFEKADTDVLKQSMPVGRIRPEIASQLHLPEEAVIYQGGVDAHMNMIGLGVCRAGNVGISMGSSFAQLALVEEEIFMEGIWGPSKDAIVPDLFCLEGGQVSAGSITKWFIKEFNITGENPYLKMSGEANKIPPGSEGLIALDFFQGNRTPYKDPDAKGAFFGLTLSHTNAHIYRSILESIAFGAKNILDTMDKDDKLFDVLKGCGGVVHNRIWLHIIADIIQKPIELSQESSNAGVLGCAILSAVGSGAYDSIEKACASMVHVNDIIEPDNKNQECYQQSYEKYKDLYRRLKA